MGNIKNFEYRKLLLLLLNYWFILHCFNYYDTSLRKPAFNQIYQIQNGTNNNMNNAKS